MARKSFAIDCFIDSGRRALAGYAAVAVDVIRATTVAVTIVELGRKCFYAPSVSAAVALASKIGNPLLVGEVGGNMPYGFDLNNSPVEIERLTEVVRPAIIVSTSGTPLMNALRKCRAAYVACLRNYRAMVERLIGRHDRILLVGARTRGEFREEDQLCCAWMGAGLLKAGYAPEDEKTARIVAEWKGASVEVCAQGKSAEFLRASGQVADLEYILQHVDDVKGVFAISDTEIVKIA